MRTDGRTYRHTDMAKLRVVFHNLVNAPENLYIKLGTVTACRFLTPRPFTHNIIREGKTNKIYQYEN
jgi:hypothetical protein